MSNLERDLDNIVKNRLGYGVYVSKYPTPDSPIVVLGVNIPKIIDDSKTEERTIRFLKFDSIGAFEVEKENQMLKVILPDVERLKLTVSDKMSKLVFGVERSLLEETYHKLVRISFVQMALNPIQEVLVSLYESGGELSIERLYRYREKIKMDKYLSFLERLELIRNNKGSIVCGNKFNIMEAEIKKAKKDEQALYNALLADVLRGGFSYISEYLRLFSILPFIRWSTSYYMPSIERQELFSMDEPALIKSYRKIYVKKPLEIKATNHINELVSVGILHREGRFLNGDEGIFKGVGGILSI
jgi:hypothetical protein